MKRRLRHVALVFGKELRETLRDRRTLAVMILFPVVVYPLLSLLVGQVVMRRESRYDEQPVQVAATPGSKVARELALPGVTRDLKLEWVPEATAADVSHRKIEVFVRQEATADAAPTPVRLVYDASREASVRAHARLSAHLAAQLVPGSLHAYAVEEQDVGSAVSRGGYVLSKVVPLLVVLMVILGAFYPAIDTTAGERERSTLETTLVAPLRRIDLLAGKVLAVATLALMSGVLNLGSLSLTLVQLARTADATALPVPWGRLSLAVLVLPPAAIMFASVMVMAATAAKSFKEAQNYLTPIYFAFFAPAIAASLGEFDNTFGWSLVPGLNLTLLTRDLILGEARLLPLCGFGLSTALVTLFALKVSSYLFDSERLLAVETRGGRRARRSAGQTMPGPARRPLDETDAAVAFACALVSFLALAPVSRQHLLVGTLLSQWGGMLGLAVVYVRLRGLRAISALHLSPPGYGPLFAGALLGSGSWMLVGLLTQWLAPPSEETLQSLRQLLSTYSSPWALFLFALTPAVCEEFLFRGLILRGLLRRFPPGLSILLVSLLFGIFHWNLDRLLPTATLGLLLGFAAWRSDSLWPPILLHGVNNGILVTLAISGQDQAFERLEGAGPVAALTGGGVAVLLGLYLLLRAPSPGRAA